MGATGWICWGDYDADPNRALRLAQQGVFDRGDYVGPGGRLGLFGHASRKRAFARRPASIEALRRACGEEGTGSILDMSDVDVGQRRVGRHPLLGTPIEIVPPVRFLTRDELMSTFGTEQPTRAQIEEAVGDLGSDLTRGEGLAVIAYEAAVCTAICWIGVSGD